MCKCEAAGIGTSSRYHRRLRGKISISGIAWPRIHCKVPKVMQCLSLVHRDNNDITYVASIKEQGYQYAKRLKQTFVVVLQLRENGMPMQIARLRVVSLLWPSLRLGSLARIEGVPDH